MNSKMKFGTKISLIFGLLLCNFYITSTGMAQAVQVSWNPNPEPDIDYYEIYRAKTSTSFRNLAQVSAPDTSYLDYDVEIGNVYFYRIRAINLDRVASDFSNEVSIEISEPVKFNLSQNYPNPFNPETTFDFYVSEKTEVSFAIYNLLGRKVKTLLKEKTSPGNHSITWDGQDDTGNQVPSGIYFAKMIAGGFSQVRKILLQR